MPESNSVRLVVADSQPVFRYGLKRLLETNRHIRVVAEASNMAEAITVVRDRRPDLLMLSLEISGGGADGLAALAALDQPVRCIVLSKTNAGEGGLAARTPCVYGVLPKEATGASFLKCIEAVRQNRHWVSDETPASGATEEAAGASEPQAGGGYGLTPRELQIIARVVNGASNKDICAQLSISLDTVKHHLASIFDKTGVGSRLELAIFALYHGIAFFD